MVCDTARRLRLSRNASDTLAWFYLQRRHLFCLYGPATQRLSRAADNLPSSCLNRKSKMSDLQRFYSANYKPAVRTNQPPGGEDHLLSSGALAPYGREGRHETGRHHFGDPSGGRDTIVFGSYSSPKTQVRASNRSLDTLHVRQPTGQGLPHGTRVNKRCDWSLLSPGSMMYARRAQQLGHLAKLPDLRAKSVRGRTA